VSARTHQIKLAKRTIKYSKRVKQLKEIKLSNFSSIIDIIKQVQLGCTAKFDESIDIHIKLGVDPKKSTENIRTTVLLPYGIKNKKNILVFADGEDINEAKKAGAFLAGGEELIEQIKTNNKILANIDVCLTTPDMTKKLGVIAKILGPAGLMPNLKDGTILKNISSAIQNISSGNLLKIKNDSGACISCRVGKQSFTPEQIEENIKSIVNEIKAKKPPKVKYLTKNAYISSTMGIGINVPLKYL